jgi:hypothetical protein
MMSLRFLATRTFSAPYKELQMSIFLAERTQYRKPAPIHEWEYDNDKVSFALWADAKLNDEPIVQDDDPAHDWFYGVDFEEGAVKEGHSHQAHEVLNDESVVQDNEPADALGSDIDFDEAEFAELRTDAEPSNADTDAVKAEAGPPKFDFDALLQEYEDAKPEDYDVDRRIVSHLPNFRETPDGLQKLVLDRRGNGNWMTVCSELRVLAQGRSFLSTHWKLLFEVKDPDGIWHQMAVPNEMRGNWPQLSELLCQAGWMLRATPGSRTALLEYLTSVAPAGRVRFVNRVGWHGNVFAVRGLTYGEPVGDRVVLENADDSPLFRRAGTLEQAKTEIFVFCKRNSRLITTVATALAGPLLNIIGAESRGIHFYGNSSKGKSTALAVGGSVWGGGGPRGNIGSWRTTDNALEAKARLHCDCAMMMDEMGEVEPRVLQASVYMLVNGAGKARATKDGGSRPVSEWQLMFVSTGETPSEERMSADGRRVMAGQLVRLIDLPASPAVGFGLFEDLHGFADGAELSNHLKMATQTYYGTVAHAFLEMCGFRRSRPGTPKSCRASF